MSRPRWRRIFLVAALALIAVAAFLWHWSKSPPAWYHPPDPNDERVAALADRFEYGLVEHAQRIRPIDESWTVRLRAEHMNAWLAARLPAWIAHDAELQWPANLGTPQVNLEPGVIHLALPVTFAGTSPSPSAARTLVLTLRPRIVNQQLQLPLERIAMGKLAMSGQPMANLVSILQQAAPQMLDDPAVQHMMDVFSGRTPVDPIIELADGRHVRATQIAVFNGFAEVTACTIEQ